MMQERTVVYLADEGLGRKIADALGALGVEPVFADSARSLGLMTERHKPTSLVIDGPLSEHPGIEALQWLRRAGLAIPALIVCGSTYEAEALAGRIDLRPFVTCREVGRQAISEALDELRRSAADPIIAPAGRLEEVDAVDLFLFALKRRWTGHLHLESRGVAKTAYIRRGVPVSCASNILSENLGKILIQRQLITESDYARARELQLARGIQQGQALIQLGVIDEAALNGQLADQAYEKLVNTLAWTTGDYRLVEQAELGKGVPIYDIHPLAFLFDGVERFRTSPGGGHDWARMRHMWGVAFPDGPEMAELMDKQVLGELYRRLEEPRLLCDTALELGWEPSRAQAVFTVLQRYGYLKLASRPERLPVPAQSPPRRETPSELRAVTAPRIERPTGTAAKAHTHSRGLEALNEAHSRAVSATPCELLGVDESAPREAIVQARNALLDEYSEERYRSLLTTAEHARTLGRLRDRIKDAASGLLDKLPSPFASSASGRATREVSMRRLVSAEEVFQRGLDRLEDDPDAAKGDFRRAMELHPGDPLFSLFLGWAQYAHGQSLKERVEGRERVEAAVALNPSLIDGQLILARVLRSEGNLEAARRHAELALSFDGDHREAQVLADELSRSVEAAPFPP